MKTMLRKLQKVMENNNGAMKIWFKDMEIVRLSWFCFVLDCVRGLYSQNTCTKDHKVTDGVHPQIDVKEWFFIEELKGILDHYFECRCDWFTEKMRCIFTHWCHVVIFQSLNLVFEGVMVDCISWFISAYFYMDLGCFYDLQMIFYSHKIGFWPS